MEEDEEEVDENPEEYGDEGVENSDKHIDDGHHSAPGAYMESNYLDLRKKIIKAGELRTLRRRVLLL